MAKLLVVDGRLVSSCPGRAPRMFGLTQTGLRAAVDQVAQFVEVQLAAFRNELTTASYALLRREILDDARRPAVERSVFRIAPTPFVFSALFIQSDFLRQDAEEYAACRTAVAYIEDNLTVPPGKEGEAVLFATLKGWRKLYRQGGTSRKVVNRILSDWGETTDPTRLWALRDLKLRQRIPSQAHADLLGVMSPMRSTVRLPETWTDTVLGYDAEDVAAYNSDGVLHHQLGRAGHDAIDTVARALLRGLAIAPKGVDPPAMSLAVGMGLSVLAQPHGPNARVAIPQIPLPQSKNVDFIATRKGLDDESARMNHCVSGYFREALNNWCYLFHVDGPGGGATVCVNHKGKVVEVRGPGNISNETVARATERLRRWGRGMWKIVYDPDANLARRGFVAPRGTKVIKSLDDAWNAYTAVVQIRPDDDGAISKWFDAQVSAAIGGRQMLVQSVGHDVGHEVFVVDRHGNKLDTVLRGRTRVGPVPDADAYGVDRDVHLA